MAAIPTPAAPTAVRAASGAIRRSSSAPHISSDQGSERMTNSESSFTSSGGTVATAKASARAPSPKRVRPSRDHCRFTMMRPA